MKKALEKAGLTAWQINALMTRFEIGANGGEIDTTSEVQRLTWKAPHTFEQFVIDYKFKFIEY